MTPNEYSLHLSWFVESCVAVTAVTDLDQVTRPIYQTSAASQSSSSISISKNNMHHNSYNNRDYGGHQSGYGGHSSPHSQSYSSGPSPHHMPSHHPGMLPPPQYNSMIMVAGETIPTRPDEISRSLPIPEYKIGWIIGKRGSYINQLAKKSGASISISDSSSKEYGTVWKYVQIRGSGRAVDRAKKLLHIRLERLEPRPVEEGEAPGHKVTNRFGGLDTGHVPHRVCLPVVRCGSRVPLLSLVCLVRSTHSVRSGEKRGSARKTWTAIWTARAAATSTARAPCTVGTAATPATTKATKDTRAAATGEYSPPFQTLAKSLSLPRPRLLRQGVHRAILHRTHAHMYASVSPPSHSTPRAMDGAGTPGAATWSAAACPTAAGTVATTATTNLLTTNSFSLFKNT